MTIIGIRKEDKNRWERRAPLVPEEIKKLKENFGIKTVVESSSIRAFHDDEYVKAGAQVVDGVPDVPILFGVKEIPLHYFKKGGVYVFFAHVIKGQKHNMPMLKRMMELGCTLIDYEKITDEKGRRLVFFGKEAGQAGMLDTLWALGKRLEKEGFETPFSEIKRTVEYSGLEEAKRHLKEIGKRISENGLPEELSPLIVGFAGYGNVSQGAQEVFDELPHKEIEPGELEEFKKKGKHKKTELYKVVFKEEHIVELKEEFFSEKKNGEFDLFDYYNHPEKYKGVFSKYVPHLTVLMNCIYWDQRYPRLVTKKLIKEIYEKEVRPTFRVVGDISCDIEGAIEATIMTREPDAPVFIYNPFEDAVKDDLSERGLAIMAVDNLPAELPKESSTRFSKSLYPYVSAIAKADYSVPFEEIALPPEIKRAVILYKGELTPEYKYIEKFLSEEVKK